MSSEWTKFNDILRGCTEKQAVRILEKEKKSESPRIPQLLRAHQKVNSLRWAREVSEINAMTSRSLSKNSSNSAASQETIAINSGKRDKYTAVLSSRPALTAFLRDCSESEAVALYEMEVSRKNIRRIHLYLICSRINRLRAHREREELLKIGIPRKVIK